MTAAVAPGAVYSNAPQPTRWPTGPALDAWPVGAVFVSVANTDPATLLGYGTWVAFGAGQFLVGYAALDPDFGTGGATGGARTITIDDHDHHTHTVTSSAGGAAAGGNAVVAAVDGATGTETPTLVHTAASNPAIPTLPPFVVVFFWQRTA